MRAQLRCGSVAAGSDGVTEFGDKCVRCGWVEFPSESGWGSADKAKTSRVFLKFKAYTATVKIVSRETEANEFPVQIDPFNKTTPLTLR